MTTPNPTWEDIKKELPSLFKSTEALIAATVGDALISAGNKLEKTGAKLMAIADKLETEAENNNK